MILSKMRWRFVSVFLLFVSCLCAQRQTGELRLHVQDPSGLPIPASAQLVGLATQTRISVTLYQDGSYTFKDLPFGSYRLTIAQSGFQTVSEPVDLRSELPVVRQVTLAIASIGSAIEVREDQTLVDPG